MSGRRAKALRRHAAAFPPTPVPLVGTWTVLPGDALEFEVGCPVCSKAAAETHPRSAFRRNFESTGVALRERLLRGLARAGCPHAPLTQVLQVRNLPAARRAVYGATS